MKCEYIVVHVYENYSDKFDIGHGPPKGQGHGATLKLFTIYRNTNCEVPTLVQARKLIFIYKFYKYRHAQKISLIPRKC